MNEKIANSEIPTTGKCYILEVKTEISSVDLTRIFEIFENKIFSQKILKISKCLLKTEIFLHYP